MKMNRADRMIRRYLFIDINSLFANAGRAFLLLGKSTIILSKPNLFHYNFLARNQTISGENANGEKNKSCLDL